MVWSKLKHAKIRHHNKTPKLRIHVLHNVKLIGNGMVKIQLTSSNSDAITYIESFRRYFLNSKKISTLKAVFENPTRKNIHWDDIINLFKNLGAEIAEKKVPQ